MFPNVNFRSYGKLSGIKAANFYQFFLKLWRN